MADIEHKTMQQQTTTYNSKQKTAQQQQGLFRHCHQALSEKLLKVILKVPHSSPPSSINENGTELWQEEQVDLVKPSCPRQKEQVSIVNSSSLRPTEQGQEFHHSRFGRGEIYQAVAGPAQAIGEKPEHTSQLEEEVHLHHSPSDLHRSHSIWREVQQVDEGAVLERYQKQQEEHHTTPYPKWLRSAYQGQQEQGRSQFWSPKVQPQHSLELNLTKGSLQEPHGLHQSSDISYDTSSSHLASPSTSASMQSSAQSSSTSAASDDAQKPSKKRKLQSFLELESTDGQSIAADGAESQLQVDSSMPVATSAADLPVVLPSIEIDKSKERITTNSSPKQIVQYLQFIPTRRLLNHILDRLQKKDKFGVFAEPVDIKEVPEYYDIIKDPMDFGTMRSRVSRGHYTSIQLFQNDIFLICDNAVQFNGKGTVYYRHACSIKDTAERILEEVKVSGSSLEMDEPTTKFSNRGTGRSCEKQDSCVDTGSPSDTRLDNVDEFSGFFLRRRGSMDGKRCQGLGENRRSTYLPMSTSYPGNNSLLATISGDSSHLVPTGYQMDYPYSKSLVKFAADLGPLVWNYAAEMIRKGLPQGCPFGAGWVGERESGGVMLASASKQQVVMQSATQKTAKLPIDGAIAIKAECQSGVQASAKLLNEMRSLMVFGNSLVQNERPGRLDQRALGQPAAQPITRLHNLDDSRPAGQAHSQADKKCSVKIDQMSGILGNKSKFTGQVNLNHPVSLQPDERSIVDNGLSNQGGVLIGRDALEGNVLPGSGPSKNVIPVPNVWDLPFHLGGALNSTPPHTDVVNAVKAKSGEMRLITAARNQFDGRGTVQFRTLNPSNDGPRTEAGSIVTSSGKNSVIYQPNSVQMSCGSLMLHNRNSPVQQPCCINGMNTRDDVLFDPVNSASCLSHSAQGNTLQCNSISLVQQTAGSSQHSNSSNHVGSRDVSPVDQGLSIQPAPLCLDQALGERFKETGDLLVEKDVPSLSGRMATGSECTMPTKGLTSEQGVTTQQLEPRKGQISSHDLVGATIHNLDQLKNASAGLQPASVSAGLPTSHGASMVREVPGCKPAQLPDSIPVTGKGGVNLLNQVVKSHAEQLEVNSDGVASMRPQTSGVQDSQIFGFGSKKLVLSKPHFLQQQLGSDNIHGLPNQHQQVQLHVQSNSLLPDAQNPGEANFVRQFQLPSHHGYTQTAGQAWKYMPQQMVAHASHQSFAVAPDLNVSIPLTKSSFDQPNGNELQQPDLALQL